MHRRLIISLGLLVGLPVVGLTTLAVKVAKDQDEMAAMQWRDLLEGRLRDLANAVATQTEDIEREALATLNGAEESADGLRQLVRETPLVTQAFLLDADGRLMFPPDNGSTSLDERAFLSRTQPIWSRKAILYGAPAAEEQEASAVAKKQVRSFQRGLPPPRPRKKAGSGDSLIDLATDTDSGWITWYWQEGLHLLLWRRLAGPDGAARGVVGVEIDRVSALARIVGRLPEPANLEGRIVLVNGAGQSITQWGPLEPALDASPAARVRLDPPWDAWRLFYYSPAGQQPGFQNGRFLWGLGLGMAAFVISVIGLAVYVYRESEREMREAAQRVTFVTQVSHELKTPLTNIRLYAELLDRDLDDEADDSRRRVATIVSEAQRLSRLISNILTFSRQRRGKLSVAPRPVDLDRRVEAMVEQFRPALAGHGIEVETSLAAPEPTFADPDTVDQIVANLLSNVEKYAASGGWVRVATRQDDGESFVVVEDRGPGISAEHAERVFMPFYRVSDRLADGVTGTGLGLALSAELARKNRGALRLVPTDRGACFELALPRRKGETT